MNEPWILADFRAALAQLDSALQVPAAHEVVKAGCIQYFEFSFELAWKAVRMAAEDLGLPACQSPKACLKVAFAQGWIEDETLWLQMLEARNRMSHTYSARRALDVYDRLTEFAGSMRALLNRLAGPGGIA